MLFALYMRMSHLTQSNTIVPLGQCFCSVLKLLAHCSQYIPMLEKNKSVLPLVAKVKQVVYVT